jgi:hypothetical protein
MKAQLLAILVILTGCGYQYSGPARQLYTLAKNGDSDAMLSLGRDCLNGNDGAPLDKKEGVEWIKRAATAGNTDAAWNYGMILFCGSYGVARDEAMFRFWIKKSPRLAGFFKTVKETAMRCLIYASDYDGQSPADIKAISAGENIPIELEKAFAFYPCNLSKLAESDKDHTVIVAAYSTAFDGTIFIMADGSAQGGPGNADNAAKERAFVFPPVVAK